MMDRTAAQRTILNLYLHTIIVGVWLCPCVGRKYSNSSIAVVNIIWTAVMDSSGCMEKVVLFWNCPNGPAEAEAAVRTYLQYLFITADS